MVKKGKWRNVFKLNKIACTVSNMFVRWENIFCYAGRVEHIFLNVEICKSYCGNFLIAAIEKWAKDSEPTLERHTQTHMHTRPPNSQWTFMIRTCSVQVQWLKLVLKAFSCIYYNIRSGYLIFVFTCAWMRSLSPFAFTFWNYINDTYYSSLHREKKKNE